MVEDLDSHPLVLCLSSEACSPDSNMFQVEDLVSAPTPLTKKVHLHISSTSTYIVPTSVTASLFHP